jgi:hypothetical protein
MLGWRGQLPSLYSCAWRLAKTKSSARPRIRLRKQQARVGFRVVPAMRARRAPIIISTDHILTFAFEFRRTCPLRKADGGRAGFCDLVHLARVERSNQRTTTIRAGTAAVRRSKVLRISRSLLRDATNYDNGAKATSTEGPGPERSSFIRLI